MLDEKLLEQSISYNKKRIRKNRLKRVVSALACIVVFCTTYALILPAITVEKEAFCGDSDHEHTLACYSDTSKDVETEAVWEASFDASQLTGIWADDLVRIAQSQIGYSESVENYQAEEGDTIQGYTRYGAWQQTPYAEWNGLFAAFCLHYAGLSDVFPAYTDENWLGEIMQMDQFQLFVQDYLPRSGDLVILRDVNSEGTLRIAVVTRSIEVTDASKAKIVVVEGDVDGKVCENYYELENKWVYGYVGLPQQQLFCDLEVHNHLEKCYTDGALTCSLQEHVHESACLRETAEEQQEETKPEVTQEAEKEAEPEVTQEAEKEAEPEVTQEAEKEAEPEVTQEAEKEAEPEAQTGEVSLPVNQWNLQDGTKMYFKARSFYAESEHELVVEGENGRSGMDAITFILTPDASDSWIANPSKDWTAKSNANYIVVYCSDADTSIHTDQPQEFTAYTMNSSRFTSQEQRRVLAGIIAHSYPYITADDMKEQVLRGITDVNLQEGLKNCNEHEFIAATQWAIWETTMMGHKVQGVYSYYDDPCAGIVNLKETPKSHFTFEGVDTENPNASNTYVKAIKDWLIRQAEDPDLAVDTCSYKTSYDWQSGTYSLQVTASLNRAVKEGENAAYVLRAGEKNTQSVQMSAGEQTITMSISSLSLEELASAQVQLSVSGEHMQAYFFDSETQQDMIGGRWEEYTDTAAFDVDIDMVDVSVHKVWSDSEEVHPEITVRLYANDEEYDSVVLNTENQWSHTWKDLPKKVNDTEVTYTVTEDPVAGYSGETGVIHKDVQANVWSESADLEDGAVYLLFSSFKNLVSNGALAWNNNVLSWEKADPTGDPDKTPASVVWKPESADNGQIYLYHAGGKGYLSGAETYTLSPSKDSAAAFTYDKENGYICHTESDKTYYLAYITSGALVAVTNVENATSFTLYKKTEASVKTEISYTITNSKLPDDNYVSIMICKIDAKNENILSGAKFSLYEEAESSSGNSVIPHTNPAVWGVKCQDITIGESGSAELINLLVGRTYYLVETEPPEGYVLLPDAIGFSVSEKEDGTKKIQLKGSSSLVDANEDGSLVLTVKNQQGYTLPETGGGGTILYTIGGLTIFGGAAILLWIDKKRERGIRGRSF